MDLKIINCKKCGKLYNRVDKSKFCPACMKALEEKFFEVREYIRNNEGAGIIEVARETDVSVDQIKDWIREERIELNSAGDPEFCCLSCGTPVRTGKYCEACKGKMMNSLKGVYVTNPSPEREGVKHSGEQMRFLQR